MFAQLLLVTLLASAAIAAPAPTPLPKSCATNNFRIENRDLAQLATDGFVDLASAYGSSKNWDQEDAFACWKAAHGTGHHVAVMEHHRLDNGRVGPTFRCNFKTVPTSPEFKGHTSLMDTTMYGDVKLTLKLGLGHYTVPGYNVQVDKAAVRMTQDQFNAKYEHCDIVSEVDGSVECKVFDKADNKMVILGFGCI